MNNLTNEGINGLRGIDNVPYLEMDVQGMLSDIIMRLTVIAGWISPEGATDDEIAEVLVGVVFPELAALYEEGPR